MKLFLFWMDEVTMFLAGYTFFEKSVAIDLHGRPDVAGTEDSGSHGACIGVIAAYAFV